MAKPILSWLCLLGLTATISCSTAKKADRTHLLSFKYSYCSPPNPYSGSIQKDKDTLPAVLASRGIGLHDRLLCKMLGIGGYVNDLLALKKDSIRDHKNFNDNKRLLLKQQIDERISVAQTELEAVAAELDCEGERSNLAATYLDNLNSIRNNRLTIGSVVTGALTTVATVLVSGKDGQTAIGVSGGVLSAGLALLTISPKGREVEFYHDRNLLKSIWKDEAISKEYPLFVWNMLQEKQFSNSGEITLAQSIKNRWLQFEFNGKIDEARKYLLFGKGGYYHSDDLHTRAALLNQLQSTIRSVNQDLASLIVFIERSL